MSDIGGGGIQGVSLGGSEFGCDSAAFRLRSRNVWRVPVSVHSPTDRAEVRRLRWELVCRGHTIVLWPSLLELSL